MVEKIREIKFSRLKSEIKSIYNILNKTTTQTEGDRIFIIYNDNIVGTYSTISKNTFLSFDFFNELSDKKITDFDYLELCVIDVLSDVFQIEISEIYITKVENLKKSIKELEYEIKY